MPGRVGQLRHQLHLHGQVPGPAGDEPNRALGVLGVLVLGETVTAGVLAGIALVLARVALTRRRSR